MCTIKDIVKFIPYDISIRGDYKTLFTSTRRSKNTKCKMNSKSSILSSFKKFHNFFYALFLYINEDNTHSEPHKEQFYQKADSKSDIFLFNVVS